MRTSSDSGEAHHHSGETSLRATLLHRSVLVNKNKQTENIARNLLELTCGARSPEGKSHQNEDVSYQNLMTCANVTKFELFFGRDQSRTWNQMSPLDPFLVPFLREIALVSSLSSSETGSKKVRTDGRTNGRTDERTHMIFWDLPCTISPSGKNILRASTIDSKDCVSPSSRRRGGGRSYKVVSIKVFFKVKPAAGADFLGFDSGNYGRTLFLNTSTVLFTD